MRSAHVIKPDVPWISINSLGAPHGRQPGTWPTTSTLRTIIASGYSGGVTDIIPTDIAFLPKPFDAVTLVSAVRQCLDETG